jgi:hypothetical protein
MVTETKANASQSSLVLEEALELDHADANAGFNITMRPSIGQSIVDRDAIEGNTDTPRGARTPHPLRVGVCQRNSSMSPMTIAHTTSRTLIQTPRGNILYALEGYLALHPEYSLEGSRDLSRTQKLLNS